MDWERHLNAVHASNAEATRQQEEQERLQQANSMKSIEILRSMDAIAMDFLASAREQGFPGARPHIVAVPKLITKGFKRIERGLEYSSHSNSSYACVVSNSEWQYREATEESTNNYQGWILCKKEEGRLEARGGFGPSSAGDVISLLDANVPGRLMGALARIAVENNIRL